MWMRTTRISVCVINFGVFLALLYNMGFVDPRSYVLFLGLLLIGMLVGLRNFPRWLNTITVLCLVCLGISALHHHSGYQPLYQDDSWYLSEGLELSRRSYRELYDMLVSADTTTADNYKYVVGMILRLFERNYMGVLCINSVFVFATLSLLVRRLKDSRRFVLVTLLCFEFVYWGGFIFKDLLVGLLILIQVYLLGDGGVRYLRVCAFLLLAIVIDEFKVGLGLSTVIFGLISTLYKKNLLNSFKRKIGAMSILVLVLAFFPTYVSVFGVPPTYADKIAAYADFIANKDHGSGLLNWLLNVPAIMTPLKVLFIPVPLALDIGSFGLTAILSRVATFLCFLRWFFASGENHSKARFVNLMCVFWFSWITVFMPGVFRHIVPFIPLLVYSLRYEKSHSLPRWIPALSWRPYRSTTGNGGCPVDSRSGIQ